MTTDTNTLSYWLNWRFFLCALFLSTVMIVAALLIWKYEGSKRSKSGSRDDSQVSVGSLYEDELWRTCLKEIHPLCLLAYRMLAFALLFGLILSEAIVSGGRIFLFYTQWTFTLVTLYFGLATSFSIYGCCRKRDDNGSSTEHTSLDAERGTYVPPTLGVNSLDVDNSAKSLSSREGFHTRKAAGVGGYAFQIIFQVSAGAVVLTDIVFWFILYPFILSRSRGLSFFIVTMHSVNAVCLLGETILNGLRYPFFRIGYFVLWTGIFVIFQWILHACVSMPWPYPFLDLSPPSAPLWYVGVGLMNVPCFGVFALLIKMKQSLLPKLFPRSFQELS
ncbi:uncharacterized protein LOC101209375 isoform X2 [Cucumis sativus]|uniref:Transmembrane protein n=2 Tax=Cucumis sativus TaxID=3659 RepID=A0A0A0LNB4_CUCSA|nr:uncharacterized protein LOC101209375 isoform X2 [Cucumis sativus]XP_011649489.1 uncharacterized protein LOC101209375 isoform X2 [Cucumis sativus]XP_031736970.1 uncharacterized protein LOC101209375 isoform X2 [Cucumis sativus]KGN62302.1 hypothetical protein Csa_018566 [Cucumis sativus]